MSEQPVVTINDGKLRGCVKVDWLGGKYYSFQGIPYAKPPIGKLRFKAPQAVDAWKDIKDATREGNDCFSRHMIKQNLVGSEDCLFLNVYTPKLPNDNDKPKAVMVWIHGGAFTSGSGSSEYYGPDFLISEDVVVVTINYRIGLLGFACFSDPLLEIPGNAGLKDQVLALKWVQNNISKFGGDPNNVTIFGESAGSVSVHLLMLSPTTKGLFHRAICQSGISTSNWPRGQLTAQLVATALGLEDANEPEIVNILMDSPVEKVLEIQEQLPELASLSSIRSFGPVVESYNNSAFLLRNPIDILRSGSYCHVPLMIGYTSREGMLFEFFHRLKFGEIKWPSDFEDLVPSSLRLSKGSKNSKDVAEEIKQYYYGNETPSHDNIDQFYLLYTDTFFFIGINNAVREQIKTSSCPTYYYRMSLDSRLNMFKKAIAINNPGVAHGDDIGYLFKNVMTPEVRPNSTEGVAIRRFVKLWSTFAKNGDPNPIKEDSIINVTWPPVENNQLHYLDIGENLTLGVNPENIRVEFWDKMYDLYACKS